MNIKKFLKANLLIVGLIIGTAVVAPWVIFAAIYLLFGLFGGYMILLLLIPILLAITSLIMLVGKKSVNHYLNKSVSNLNDKHHGSLDVSSGEEIKESGNSSNSEVDTEATTSHSEDWAAFYQEAVPSASLKTNTIEETNNNQQKKESRNITKYVLIVLSVLVLGIISINLIDSFIYRYRLNGEYAEAIERCGTEPLIITEVYNPFGATKTERATYYPYEESYESKKFIKTIDEKVKGYYCDMDEYYRSRDKSIIKDI